MSPRLTVVAGTGGVGKTTLSAAIGTAHAQAGRNTLVVTVDPARRLADALELRSTDRPTAIAPRLTIWMPEARAAFDQLTGALLPDPGRFRANPVTAILRAAPAGVHEVAIALTLAEVADRFDEVVLDTAPSVHALEFLDTPGRLADLLERRSLRFFMAFGGLASRLPGQGLIERAVGGVLPAEVVADGAAFFAELASVREPLAQRARAAQRLLESARFTLVAGVTPASVRGAGYLREQLRDRGASGERVLLNRLPTRGLVEACADQRGRCGPWIAALERDALRDQLRSEGALRRFPDARPIPNLELEGVALIRALAAHLGEPRRPFALTG